MDRDLLGALLGHRPEPLVIKERIHKEAIFTKSNHLRPTLDPTVVLSNSY